MKVNTTIALYASLFILIGIPLIFLVVSLFAGNWNYVLFSLTGSLAAGGTGLALTIREIGEERSKKEQ